MSVKETVISAARWTSVAGASRALLQVGQTAVLARMLEPTDFGLMAMAGTVIAFAALFSDVGISGAIIHYPLPHKQLIRQLFLLNLAAGVFLGGIIAAISSWFAALYGAPQLVPILCALALAFPVNALGQQSRAIAEKELRFASLARIDVASAASGFIVAIALATVGAGVFALVGGVLAAASINSASNLIIHGGDRAPSIEPAPPVTQFLRFGMHRLAEQVWNALRHQADVVIAAMFGSTQAVAFYATPRDYCVRISNTIVNPVITRIAFPVMASLRHDKSVLATIYLKALRFTASVNFPIFAFVGCFPNEVLLLLLGPKWDGAAIYLRIFAFWGLLRSTGHPSGSLLYAVGMVKRANIWNLAILIATIPLLLLVASSEGLTALATCMLALQVVIAHLTWLLLVKPAADISFVDYSAQLIRPAAATIVACICAWLVALAGEGMARLAMSFAAFIAVYALTSFWWNRAWLDAIMELLKPLLFRKIVPETPEA